VLGTAPVHAAPFVYVTNDFSNDVSQYGIGAGGVLAPLVPPSAPAATVPTGVAVNPDGKSVYVTTASCCSTGTISQYDLRPGGTLSLKSPPTVAAGQGPEDLAVSPDGKSIYVTNAASDDVSQYDVGPEGRLTPKSPASVAAGDGAFDVAVSPSPLVPSSKDQCKNGGWREFGFKNQGDCVSFVVSRGKNQPSGP
jgi:6-phosphogluconolactonase